MEYLNLHRLQQKNNEAYTTRSYKRGPQDELPNHSKRRKPNSTSTNTGQRIKDRKSRRMEKRNQQLNNDGKCSNTIIQWNACGLIDKWAEIQLLSNQHKPMIMALQETLFDTRKIFTKLDGSRYRWHIQPGPNPSRNGVAIAVDKTIPHKMIPINATQLQVIACRTMGKDAITYASLYVPPRHLPVEVFEKELRSIMEQLPKPFMLMGDYNAHSTEWGSFKTDKYGKAVQKLVDELSLHIMNTGHSTRIGNSKVNMSAVDLTITSRKFGSFKWEVDSDCRGSDHIPILIKVHKEKISIKEKQHWNHRKADWTMFQEKLVNSTKSKEQWTIKEVTNEIHKAAKESIPQVNRKKHKKVPWWNDEVAKVIRNRKKALRRYQEYTKIDLTRERLAKKLRIAKVRASKVIRKAKRESWEHFVQSIDKNSTNMKELWSKVNALSGKSKGQKITLVKDENNTIESPKEVAEELAEYFYKQSATSQYSKKFQKEKRGKEKRFKHNFNYENNSAPYNRVFTLDELEMALKSADGKATGIDEISYDMLRNLPTEMKIQLLEEYNKIWTKDGIPSDWKTGLVVAIPKTENDPHKPENYRPITLLSCVGKLHERMVAKRFITEAEERGLLNPDQVAFRPKMGTGTLFIEFDGIVNEAIQNEQHVELGMVDMTKAYDRTWRWHILDELKRWNIEGNMIRYIEDFLTDRKFMVEVDSARSEERIQENGIPQGAVLSVTLFLVAMNSIVRKYKKSDKNLRILVYADDIIIVVRGHKRAKTRLRNKLNKYMNLINTWAKCIGFTIAPQKSKILHICHLTKHSKSIPKVTVDGVDVPEVKYAKILGVTVDKRWNFGQHMKQVKEDVKSRCNLIKAIGSRFKGANRSTMMNIFNSLVVPKLLYGAHFYSNGPEQNWKILNASYNQTIRRITGAHSTSPTSALLAETGALSLNKLIKLETISCAIRWMETHDEGNASGRFLIERANGYAIELTEERIPDIAKLPDRIGRRWYAPKLKFENSIQKKLKAGDQKDKVKQVFLSTLENYKDHEILYTDGSVREDEVGCGISHNEEGIPIRLNKMCTIFSAESRALLIATKEVAREDKPTIVFTDSASCIAALKSGDSRHPWIERIQIEAQKKNITYCWIPSHVGIKGNDKADKLAEIGRTTGELHNQVPANDAIAWFKTRTVWTHEYRWKRYNRRFLRQAKPTTLPWKDRKSIKEQRILTRVRIGHTWLSHSWRIKKVEQPRCAHCNDILTIDHIIRMCPEFDALRMECDIPTGLEVYENTTEMEDKLLNFLAKAKLLDEL